jgi:hypothetical protein
MTMRMTTTTHMFTRIPMTTRAPMITIMLMAPRAKTPRR